LYFNHHDSLGALFIILSFMGTHQGDLLRRPLFALVYFCALCCFSEVFPSCFFLSLANDTHILNPTHVISFVFYHFIFQFVFVGLFVQLYKCSVWAPSGLLHRFVPLIEFCHHPNGIRILGVPFASTSFAFFFLQNALSRDV
jgi:hypothetical protein